MDEEAAQLEQGNSEKLAGQVGSPSDTDPPNKRNQAKSTDKAETTKDGQPPDSKDEIPVEEAHMEEAKSTEGEKVRERGNNSALRGPVRIMLCRDS
jgi:hypothetical protein